MVMLSNSPREQTLLRLEQAKSLTFGLHVTSHNNVPVDLTGATLTFHMAEQSNVPNTPGTVLFSKVAELENAERGFARFELQAAELDHKAGEYDFDITYLNASGYSVLLVKGVVQLQLNTDRTASGHTYTGSAIPQDLTVLLRGTGAISVVTGPSVPPEWTDARTAYVNEAGHLIFVTGSGALHDAGTVVGPAGASSWSAITGKPAVIAAGESVAEARAVIGAVSAEDLPDVSGLATTAALTSGLAGKQAVGDYATTASLATVATTGAYADLTGKPVIPPTPDLSGYATTSALSEGLAEKQPVGDYALVSQLPDVSGFATTTALASGLAGKQDAGNYATMTALTSGLAGKQDAGNYATLDELPDVSGLATTAYVDQTVGDIDTVLSMILGGE